MDLSRLFNMLMNMLFRRAANAGINKAVNHFAGKGKPAAQMTAEERTQAAKGREMQKRARQAARITRRMGR